MPRPVAGSDPEEANVSDSWDDEGPEGGLDDEGEIDLELDLDDDVWGAGGEDDDL